MVSQLFYQSRRPSRFARGTAVLFIIAGLLLPLLTACGGDRHPDTETKSEIKPKAPPKAAPPKATSQTAPEVKPKTAVVEKVRMHPDRFLGEFRTIETILYDDGPTTLQHLELVWWDVYLFRNYVKSIHETSKTKKIALLKGRFDMPIEPFMTTCNNLMHDITYALVYWSDKSTLPPLRAKWEALRGRFFIPHRNYKKSTPKLDELQSKREPANDSDLFKLLDRLEAFVNTSEKEGREFIDRFDRLGKGIAFTDMRSELQDQLGRWCSDWVDKEARFETCERRRPTWKRYSRKRVVRGEKMLNSYRLRRHYTIFGKKLVKSSPNQGPVQLRDALARIDYVVADLHAVRLDFGLWQLDAVKKMIKRFKEVRKNIKEARALLHELIVVRADPPPPRQR